MGWNRSASILSLVVFLAFGFQVIGVFSDPVSRSTLSIGSVGKFDYGVLGYCPQSSSKGCSSYGIGYTLQDDDTSSWSQSSQRVLSDIFVVHIVAAGLLLISFFMSLGTHWRKPSFWTATEVILSISFIAAALSFAVEIALFKAKLKFAGWFTLASTILSLVAIIALGFMQKSLRASLGKTNINARDSLFTNNPVTFQNDGDFVVGRDDEKNMLKQNSAEKPFSAPSFSNPSFQFSKAPSLKGSVSQRGYEKIPESQNPSLARMQNPNETPSIKSRAHPLPLPLSGSSESIGAISKQQQQMQQSRQRGPIPQVKQSVANGAGTVGNGVGGAGDGIAGVASGATGAAGIAGAAGAARAGGVGSYDQRSGSERGGNPTSRADRQDTWSQVALNKAQFMDLQSQQQGSSRPTHGPKASVASTQAARIPAGAYLQGVDETERYGPNVVQIPKVRAGEPRQAESATFEYAKDETQSQSPLAKSKIPNYSRMSAQESPQKTRNLNPMLERYVTSEMSSDSKQSNEPYHDAPPISRIPTKSPESEASHYTSVSERMPQSQQAHNGFGQTSESAAKQAQQNREQMAQYQDQMQSYQNNYQNYYGSYNGQQGYQGSYQGYQPQYQAAYSYGYNQPTYSGGQPGYQPGYNANYGYQPGYAPVAAPGTYMGYGPQPNPKPRPRAPPAQQAPNKSEFALQTNPDFSIGNAGKKRFPNRK